jgi:hypothetical protein
LSACAPFRRRPRRRLLLALGALVLAGCGSTPSAPPAVPPHSAAERVWVANAYRLIQLLESRIALTAAGGSSVGSARAALSSTSDLYTMLVAYTFFGGCNSEIASIGTPSARAEHVVDTLVSACSRLERASTLFHLAVTRKQPRLLVRATRLSATADPLLYRASEELVALRAS